MAILGTFACQGGDFGDFGDFVDSADLESYHYILRAARKKLSKPCAPAMPVSFPGGVGDDGDYRASSTYSSVHADSEFVELMQEFYPSPWEDMKSEVRGVSTKLNPLAELSPKRTSLHLQTALRRRHKLTLN